MNYSILIEKPAAKFISRLPRNEKQRVLKAIAGLPAEGDIKPLRGKKSRGLYRLRVGEFRVIYRVDEGRLVICVIDAGNRGEIYNRY